MYHDILVPISFDDERDVSGPLKLAGLLATSDANITLLHVIEHIPNYAVSYMPQNYLHEAHIAIQGKLDEIAATIPNAKGVLIEGHSGRSILDWTDSHSTDLIIIASHRPGMSDLLLGSTAAKVVRHAKCAVHVVR
jgi:universal stress protein F